MSHPTALELWQVLVGAFIFVIAFSQEIPPISVLSSCLQYVLARLCSLVSPILIFFLNHGTSGQLWLWLNISSASVNATHAFVNCGQTNDAVDLG